jgi:hypothetical protein
MQLMTLQSRVQLNASLQTRTAVWRLKLLLLLQQQYVVYQLFVILITPTFLIVVTGVP